MKWRRAKTTPKRYAENMHDVVLLGMPVAPLPPTDHREFAGYYLAIVAASFFTLGVIVTNLANA